MSSRTCASLWTLAVVITVVVYSALQVAVAPGAPWWFSLVTGAVLLAAAMMGRYRERARSERASAARGGTA